jgi:hypothetical protein
VGEELPRRRHVQADDAQRVHDGPRARPRDFALFRAKSGTLVAWKLDGKGAYAKATALFFLLDSVDIPARPYVQPAVQVAAESFPWSSRATTPLKGLADGCVAPRTNLGQLRRAS